MFGRLGGYLFLLKILITRPITETKKEQKRKNNSQVMYMVSPPLSSKGEKDLLPPNRRKATATVMVSMGIAATYIITINHKEIKSF